MNIDDAALRFFSGFLKKKSGYHLVPEKKYLLETRLLDVMKHYKLDAVNEVINQLQFNDQCPIAIDVIEAMTVNETLFFRDRTPFELFEKKILPEFSSLKVSGPIRIWSAACSTGQEPYSIAMILEEYNRHNPKIHYEIIASDINKKVLDRAKQGIYSDMEVNRGLPEEYKSRYFSKLSNQWIIDEKIRQAVKFQPVNLQENFLLSGSFHFVLLRNVLIYFDSISKQEVLKRVSQKMDVNGYLLLGAAENIYEMHTSLTPCKDARGLYTR